MGLEIYLTNMTSRAARKSVANDGIRRFAKNAIQDHKDSSGNLIGKLWNGFTRFAGSLISKVWQILSAGIAFSITAIYSMCVSAFQFVWNFNWNATDADLDSQIKSSFVALSGSVGGTLGNALGWLACGAVPGATIATFNEAMGLYVLERVGEEALEEIAGNLANLVRQTGMSLTKAFTVWAYKNIRTLWRKPDSVVKQQLLSGGMNQQQADDALAKRNKPWSFAKKLEDFVDGIPNEFIKNFTEELFDEFGDACIEAGYVVANSVDGFLAGQKVANSNLLGEEKAVEILLNRDTDNSTP